MKKNNVIKMLIVFAVFTFVFSFMLIGLTTKAAEPEVEATDEAVAHVQKLIDWLKSVNMDDFRGWVIGLFSYLTANMGIIILLVIKLLTAKSKEIKTSEFYQNLLAKQNEENQKNMLKMHADYEAKLEKGNQVVLEYIKKQDSEKRAEVKSNTEKMRSALDEITIDLDK